MQVSNKPCFLKQTPIAVGLGMLFTVWTCQIMFAFGAGIGVHHWWILPGFFMGILVFLHGIGRFKNWDQCLIETFAFAAVFAVALVVSSQSIATDFDGLFMHVEYVRALELGWNPILDEEMLTLAHSGSVPHLDLLMQKIEAGGRYLTFGQTIQGVLAAAFGIEASKAANWLYAYFAFRSAWYLFFLWTGEVKRAALYAFIVLLNPVILYQLPGFKHDGVLACLLSVVIISGVVLMKRRDVGAVFLFLLAAASLIGAKRTGLGYTALMTGFFVLFFCILHYRFIMLQWRRFLAGFFIAPLIGAALWVSGLWDIRPDIMLPVQQALSERGSLVNLITPHTIFDTFPEYLHMDGFQQFLATSFCETSVHPTHPNWKVPGKIHPRELGNLYQAFTGYWIGGMGPLYGLALLASILATVLLLLERPERWRWVAVALVPILVSVSLLPSLSVRWVPHIWLLTLLWVFAMEPLSESRKLVSWRLFTLRTPGEVGRVVATLATIVVLANSALVVSLTIAGQAKIRKILDTQFAILEQLPGPLPVSFDWFPSNRFWFEDRGIAFEIREHSSPRSRLPYSNLYRTNTRVYLGGDALDAPIIYPGTGLEMPLELALQKLERELPSDAYTWHWIRPLLRLHPDQPE